MKAGGQSSLLFLLKGNGDLVDAVLDRNQGGNKLERGLKAMIADRLSNGIEVEVIHETSQGTAAFRKELEKGRFGAEVGKLGRAPDIVLLSLHADLQPSEVGYNKGDGPAFAAAFESDMLEAIRRIKNDMESHIIILNASTVDPSKNVSNYHTVTEEPLTLLAQRLNLVLMRLSFQEGISIIDADRLIAEVGAANHVLGFLDYSVQACDAICGELMRIIEDYGFFDDRPLVMQVGRRNE